MVLNDKIEDLLLEYSAGSLSETPSLLVATHLALSPSSRKMVRDMEAIGGALLSLSDKEAVSVDSFDVETLSRPLEAAIEAPISDRAQASGGDMRFPEPLRSLLANTGGVAWRRKLPGLKEFRLPRMSDGCNAMLYQIKANRSMPQHTHQGDEITLVLEGGFSDHTGSYKAGDIAVADPNVDHRPNADPDGDCICFAVTDGPLKLTGPIGRIVSALANLK